MAYGYINYGEGKQPFDEESETAKIIKEQTSYLMSTNKEALVCDMAAKIEEYTSRAIDVKYSRGASDQGYFLTYGMFPPHPDVYIFDVTGNQGHITKRSDGKLDFKYYFDEKGRAILIEKYGRDNPKIIGKIMSRVFIDYDENYAHVIALRNSDKGVVCICRCKLDNSGRLLEYINLSTPRPSCPKDNYSYYWYSHDYISDNECFSRRNIISVRPNEPIYITRSRPAFIRDGLRVPEKQ